MEAVAPTQAGALRACSGRRRTDRSQNWGSNCKGPSQRIEETGSGPVLVGPDGGVQGEGGSRGMEQKHSTWPPHSPVQARNI